MTPHRTSLSSPPSWMIWPIDSRFFALIKHCLLHSISCSRSRHIFTCSMLALWLSLTIFCSSRNFWRPHVKRNIGEKYPAQTQFAQNYMNPNMITFVPTWCKQRYVKSVSLWHSTVLWSDEIKTNGIYSKTEFRFDAIYLNITTTQQTRCIFMAFLENSIRNLLALL